MTAGRVAKIAAATFAIACAAAVVLASRVRPPDAQCASGFVASGSRCCVAVAADGSCTRSRGLACPSPLVESANGAACDAPEVRARVDETSVLVGPSDWEAEGRVTAREVHAGPFAIDVYEATVGRAFCPTCPLADAKRFTPDDAARAASGLSRDEAIHYCAAHGGRLPTEDEWILAASTSPERAAAHRYPWGDTGAVCRRAAWGLATGPCSHRGAGPDTVGAHPTGAASRGLQDMAGNVAEWVQDAQNRGIVRGGSWRSALATELRTWARVVADPRAHDDSIGVRCAYDVLAK